MSDFDYDEDPDTNYGQGWTCVGVNHSTGEKDYYHFERREYCMDPNSPPGPNSSWLVPPPQRLVPINDRPLVPRFGDGGASSGGNGGHTVDVSGACRGNGQPNATAGFGISHGLGHPNNVSAPVPPVERQTHNRAELRAVLHTIKEARASGKNEVTIRTKSEYVANGFNEYLDQWEKQGFRRNNGKPLENEDLWREIAEARRGMNVQVLRDSGPNDARQLARDAAASGHKFLNY